MSRDVRDYFLVNTTVICIRSSSHRDIPLERVDSIQPSAKRFGKRVYGIFHSLRRDAPFVMIAGFFSELLLYYAINQHICARKVFKTAPGLKSFKVPSDSDEDE